MKTPVDIILTDSPNDPNLRAIDPVNFNSDRKVDFELKYLKNFSNNYLIDSIINYNEDPAQSYKNEYEYNKNMKLNFIKGGLAYLDLKTTNFLIILLEKGMLFLTAQHFRQASIFII